MSSDLAVIYRDDWLIVLDKPSGLLSVPGRGPENARNLALLVQEQFPTALNVHRLDRDTSGLIVMALDAETHRKLSELFAARQVRKRYAAVVGGNVANDEGEIDFPLIKDFANPPRYKVDVALGKPALTRYRVIARGKDFTRLELEPLTGRSHQLRVHLRAIGHPILGDPLYGDTKAFLAPRLMLHAERLSFTNPQSGEPLELFAPCPF